MIYITVDSNRGTFFQRFHKNNFTGTCKENTYLIIVAEQGLSLEEAYEAYYKLAWFEDRPYTTLIVPSKPSAYGWDCDIADQDWHGGKVSILRSNVMCLQSGQIYEINDLRFMVLDERTSEMAEQLNGLCVDYILTSNLSAVENIKDKVCFKHCYIGSSVDKITDSCLVTILDEQIITINPV